MYLLKKSAEKNLSFYLIFFLLKNEKLLILHFKKTFFGRILIDFVCKLWMTVKDVRMRNSTMKLISLNKKILHLNSIFSVSKTWRRKLAGSPPSNPRNKKT